MRIARSNLRWRILANGSVLHESLETLALKEGYRVCGMCRELRMSEAYLREIFMRDLGLSPKEWMQWERMVVARRMLVWGLEPQDVSEALGFTHQNSFRREFRLVYGFAPSRFLEFRVAEFS